MASGDRQLLILDSSQKQFLGFRAEAADLIDIKDTPVSAVHSAWLDQLMRWAFNPTRLKGIMTDVTEESTLAAGRGIDERRLLTNPFPKNFRSP